MRWDIFGKKKVDRLEEEVRYLRDKISILDTEIQQLKHKFEESKQVKEIPLVKPIIRDAERAMKKEKQEPEAINMWKN